MIWAVLYILIAAASVFGLCVTHVRVFEVDWEYDEAYAMIIPLGCGIFWPIGGPIYGAFMAAIWYAKHGGKE